jgi:hypothetical protein
VSAVKIQLIDDAEEAGRSTATLLASLAARLSVLHYVTGATAVGSLVSGYVALGRAASATADGARLRRALEASRAAPNGQTLWSALKICDWLAGLPPSPLLDQLRNDLALLLAGDLDETVSLLPIPCPPQGDRGTVETPPPTAIDCIVGLWAFSRETTIAIEALAAGTMSGGRVAPAEESSPVTESAPPTVVLR